MCVPAVSGLLGSVMHVAVLPLPCGDRFDCLLLDCLLLGDSTPVQIMTGTPLVMSWIVTVPVGLPPAGLVTCAVNVTCVPYVVGLGGSTSVMVVVVVAWFTVSIVLLSLAGPKFGSPA